MGASVPPYVYNLTEVFFYVQMRPCVDTDLAGILGAFSCTQHVGCNARRTVLCLATLLEAQNGHLHFVS